MDGNSEPDMTPSTIPVEEIVQSTGSLSKAPRDSLELSYLKKELMNLGAYEIGLFLMLPALP